MRLVWAVLMVGLLAGFQVGGQLSSGNAPASGTGSEEFVGPLGGWQDVTAAPCNATGNGVTDDTVAIQTCINNLSSTKPVIWFPAHTYKVSNVSGTGTVSGASTTMTVSGATGTISQGMYVNCGGTVPAGEWVASIAGSTITLGQATSGSFSGACDFGLLIRSMDSVSLIGADPSLTIWKWAGNHDEMMMLDGNQYSRVNRITFDGGSNNFVLLDQSKHLGAFFDTGNEYSDDVFKNADNAFECGVSASGCAETTMLRNTFSNLGVGVFVGNQNALDMWVWYSTFNNVKWGLSGSGATGLGSGGGGFQCYYNVFNHSPTATTGADLSAGSNQFFNMVGCYSNNGNQFFTAGGNSGGNPIFLLGNTIRNPNTTPVVSNDTTGPAAFIGNVVQSSGAQPYFLQTHSDFGSGVLSYQNTFTSGTVGCGSANTVNLAISSTPPTVSSCTTAGDVVNGSAIMPLPPELPGPPPGRSRVVSEVSAVAGLPAAITAACGTGGAPIVGPKNVVHLQQAGSPYNISSTLTIPASDCQIIGDGQATILTWTGAADGLLMQLTGPSKVTLRNFKINLNKTGSGVLITNADQASSRVFGESIGLTGPTSAGNAGIGLFSDSLDNTLVEMHNILAFNGTNPGSIKTKVVGGASAQAGTWLGGSTNIWSGLTSGNETSFSAGAGAHLILNGVFNETSGANQLTWTTVTGAFGAATLAGNDISMADASLVSHLTANNWQGALSYLANLSNPNSSHTGGTQTTGYVTFSGTGAGAFNLTAANDFSATTAVTNSTSPTANFWVLSNGVCSNGNSCTTWGVVADANNIPITQPNLANALNQISNTRPLLVRSLLSSGVTDVQIYRLYCDSPGNVAGTASCLHIQH